MKDILGIEMHTSPMIDLSLNRSVPELVDSYYEWIDTDISQPFDSSEQHVVLEAYLEKLGVLVCYR